MKGYQQLVIPSQNGSKELNLELNWKDSQSPTDVLITVGEEKTVVDFKDLYMFVLMEATEHLKDELMPEKKVKMYKHIRQHAVIAGKDIKKGDRTIVNCEIDIPKVLVDTLREEFKSGRAVLG